MDLSRLYYFYTCRESDLFLFPIQALIDYISSDFDINVYWDTLKKNGITKERLLSYDRAIHSEPNFRSEQKEGLLRDLGNYLRTLKVSQITKFLAKSCLFKTVLLLAYKNLH